MQNSFEEELEQLVAKFSRDLAHEVTALILGRLGIEAKLTAPAARRAGGPGPRPRASAGVSTAKKPRAGKRSRMTSAQKSAAMENVLALLGGSTGLAVGEIEKRSGLSRSELGTCLKALKAERRIFMGGQKRFARYASTQAVADRASAAARG